MGKRQRSDYRDDGASSTESNDETINSSKMNGGDVCIHIQKGIDLPTIRKKIKTSGFEKLCIMCTQNAVIRSESAKELDSAGVDCTLWLCLKCGSQLCGRNRNQHALQHYTKPRSDVHALAMNTSTFDVWCYCCNGPVDPYAKPKLLDIVEFSKRETSKLRGSNGTHDGNKPDGQLQMTTESVRKLMIDVLLSTPMTNNASVDVPDAAKLGGSNQTNESSANAVAGKAVAAIEGPSVQEARLAIMDRSMFAVPGKPMTVETLSRVRGLSNLGNTCFFNAVLQCLARTPYLLPILKQSAVEGEKVHIPGGVLKLPDATETVLPPIDGELDAWRSLTEALADILTELAASATSVLSPNRLLMELTSKWPQFDGGDQHDSHELLRHLLESVRTDDLRRYQALILHSLGLEKRKSHQNVDENRKAMVRFYGDQISQWVFRPEQVFRGSLVSTLTCQDCHHTSSRHEYFLDISLPVCVEKPQPPVRRKSSPEPDGSNGMVASTTTVATATAALNSGGTGSGTRQLSKKERDREKKAKRIAKHQKNRINLSSVGGGNVSGSGSAGTAMAVSDASGAANDGDADMSHMLPLIDDMPDGVRVEESSDDSNEPSDADVEDNDVTDDPLSKGGGGSNQAVDQNGNQAQSRRSIPEKLDDSPENPNKEPEDGCNIVCTVGISSHRAAHMSKQLLHSVIAGSSETDEEFGKRRASAGGRKGRQRTYSYADWSNTIAPRYQCEDGEYSVQSCFNNFTAVELMTGNNKVCCEACTERVNGKDGKSVNTNATKQFLISVPPAVLILHLKRFQVGPRGMFKKITKPVSFPFVLDIAPFCGSKVKRASHIRPGQKKILYALYGLVEHSGSMHGGHYVAYVKVRSAFGTDDVRWKFIPQGTKDELDRKSEQEMAKEQALRMGVHMHDSDDSLSSTHSGSEVDEVDGPLDQRVNPSATVPAGREEMKKKLEEPDEEEGAVGFTAKPQEPVPDVEPPPGKWYCVSDSYVREVTEENVLKVQAYLLFYERIF